MTSFVEFHDALQNISGRTPNSTPHQAFETLSRVICGHPEGGGLTIPSFNWYEDHSVKRFFSRNGSRQKSMPWENTTSKWGEKCMLISIATFPSRRSGPPTPSSFLGRKMGSFMAEWVEIYAPAVRFSVQLSSYCTMLPSKWVRFIVLCSQSITTRGPPSFVWFFFFLYTKQLIINFIIEYCKAEIHKEISLDCGTIFFICIIIKAS